MAATAPAEPDCAFSHLFAIGEHEIASLPDTSTLATRYRCAARVRLEDVVDTEPGRTHDSGSQNPGTKEWGLLPRPGVAQVYEYPHCADGRVIADVVRMDIMVTQLAMAVPRRSAAESTTRRTGSSPEW